MQSTSTHTFIHIPNSISLQRIFNSKVAFGIILSPLIVLMGFNPSNTGSIYIRTRIVHHCVCRWPSRCDCPFEVLHSTDRHGGSGTGYLGDPAHSNDDVIKWKHFPRYWPFVRGIHRSPVNSPHKGQWRRALLFFFICAWINGWVNNREAGDLRRHRAHYDVTVMRC